MSSIAAISTFLPAITSGSIFAPRRVNKGTEADNALVATMNFGIAGGQIGNVFRGVASLAKASGGDVAAKIVKLDNAVGTMANELSKTDKVMNGLIKAGHYTMRNINPAIGTLELANALMSEDKLDASLTGGCAFGSMLLGEGAAKRILGMSKTSYKNGVCTVTPRNALYKKLPFYPFAKEQLRALKDYLITKNFVSEKVLKHVPPVATGVLFALTSIFSYAFGRKGGKYLSNCVKSKTENNKQEYKEAA